MRSSTFFKEVISMSNEILDLFNTQKISIGGTTIEIATMYDINNLEPQDPQTGLGGIDINRYMSLICHNLGYNKRPTTDEWLRNGDTIENIEKTNPIIDFPLRHSQIRINPKEMSLYDILISIYYWGRGKVEQGYLLDISKSFLLPQEQELVYNMKNGIEIKRTCVITDKQHWCISDIITRRLHNLCPHIDKDYFFNCIRNFNAYSKMIPVRHPIAFFTCGLINPTYILSMIRQCEMKAADRINQNYMNYASLRPDRETAVEFTVLLSIEIAKLHNMFKEHGAAAFVNLMSTETIKDYTTEISINADNVRDVSHDRIEQLNTIEEKISYVENTQLDETNLGFIFRFLDKESIPEYLTKTEVLNKDGIYTTTYVKDYYTILKRIYCIFQSCQENRVHWLDSENKWIISKPFYFGPNKFALYNKYFNMYLLAYPDIKYEFKQGLEAVNTYRDRYGEAVRQDPEELGDSLEAKAAANTVLTEDIPKGEEGRFKEANS